MNINKDIVKILDPLTSSLESVFKVNKTFLDSISLRFLSNKSHVERINLNISDKDEVCERINTIRKSIDSDFDNILDTIESDLRYGWIDTILLKCSYKR